jgi:hypothetical protein
MKEFGVSSLAAGLESDSESYFGLVVARPMMAENTSQKRRAMNAQAIEIDRLYSA